MTPDPFQLAVVVSQLGGALQLFLRYSQEMNYSDCIKAESLAKEAFSEAKRIGDPSLIEACREIPKAKPYSVAPNIEQCKSAISLALSMIPEGIGKLETFDKPRMA